MTARTSRPAPVAVCIRLGGTWQHGLNQAVDTLRTRHPGLPDEQLLEMLLIAGIAATIHHAHQSRG